MPDPFCPDRSSQYSCPIAFARNGWRRRIEVFSPKLDRRVSLGSYEAYGTWLVVEANPAIETFTERPARVGGTGSAMIDFWIRLRDAPAGEFWLIERRRADEHDELVSDECPDAVSSLHGLPVRVIRQSELQAWAVPIANWSRIVPYLISYRRFRDPILEQAIVVYLSKPRALDAVLQHFPGRDSGSVEGSLFALLACGRVVSPDLAIAAMSGVTCFQRT